VTKNASVFLATSCFLTFDWTIRFVVVQAENLAMFNKVALEVTRASGVWFDE
jgi:hypothetical protein